MELENILFVYFSKRKGYMDTGGHLVWILFSSLESKYRVISLKKASIDAFERFKVQEPTQQDQPHHLKQPVAI